MASEIAVCSLGLFILDTFEFRSANTPSTSASQGGTTLLKRDEGVIGGGGTYAIVGSRVWLPSKRVGILVDRGRDWTDKVQNKLDEFGKEMWTYREKEEETTKALNLYIGQHRGEANKSTIPSNLFAKPLLSQTIAQSSRRRSRFLPSDLVS